MKEFESTLTMLFGIPSLLMILILVFRIKLLVKKYQTNSFLSSTKFENTLTIITVPLWLLFIYGSTNYIYVLQRGSAFAPEYIKTVLACSLFVVGMVEIGNSLFSVQAKILGKVFRSAFLLSLGFISFILIQTATLAKHYPSSSECELIDLPFEGEWVAIGAGATGLTNHHDRIKSQKYAIDIAKVGENGKLFIEDGVNSQQSNTWGAKIISPVNGKIVFAVDTLEDDKSKKQLAGNHVIIEFGPNKYVALAHFQKNSLSVNVGDTVKIGDSIAKAGNSGNSDFPHLHIHVQTSPIYDIKETQTLAFRFKTIQLKRYIFWTESENAYLLSNDRVKK